MEVKLETFTSIAAIGTVAWLENPKHGQYIIGIKFQPLMEKYRALIIKFLNSFARRNNGQSKNFLSSAWSLRQFL
jgi:hypothetical protein